MSFNPRFAVLTVAWIAVIYWLSSMPDLSTVEEARWLSIASNLAHIPLYGVLTFFVLKTFSVPAPTWNVYALGFVLAAVYGVLDEWHQSFVPGRVGSSADVMVDVSSACGVLVAYYLWTRRRRKSSRAVARAGEMWAD